MERYTTTPQIDTTKGIPYYTTVIPTRIPTEDVPFYYTAQDGDRFDMLAYRFYGSATQWWVIAKANNLTNGSMAVQQGTILFIPNI
jgi:phage tail protein X